MMILNLVIFFIFGTVIGSFINVFVLRYNTGLSFVSGRSKCFSCGKTLAWYELIPLFSFLFLGGRCAHCKSKISYQYPLVEFISGTVSALVFWKVGMSALLPLYLFLSFLLIAMSVYDFMHKIIPNGMVFLFDLSALFLLCITHGFSPLLFGTPDFWAGPMLFAFFAFFWLVSRGRWMGLGDATLALGVGWMLGFYGGIFAIILAFWIGALISILLLGLQKLNISRLRLTIKSEIPFAPFIILGVFLQYFSGWNFLTLIHALG